MRTANERGIALVSTLLIMMMISALLIGFTTMTISEQRYRFIDKDRNQSFYASYAGLEKMTTDLGLLFSNVISPTAAQLNAITAAPPVIDYNGDGLPDVSFTRSDGTSGYQLTSQYLGSTTVSTGPFQGLYALITQYTMDANARTPSGGETHLRRQTETVASPVFQFGIFSDPDLSFFAGPDFNFGGRVHTNGNLFLSQGDNATLTLADKVTAVGEIVRKRLQNNALISANPSHEGDVSMFGAGGATGYRNLLASEGSVVDGLNSALNDPLWTNTSLTTYNAFIRNGRTGALPLNLALVGIGGANTDLVRRPAAGENVSNSQLYNERLYTRASLRILLSDTANDLLTLPGVTATAPISLEAAATYNGVPLAQSMGPMPAVVTTSAATAAGATTISVPNIPAWLARPQVTVKNAAGTTRVGPFTCTQWTLTQLSGCNVPAGLTSGWTIYVSLNPSTAALQPGNMPGAPTPSVTLNGNVTAGNPKTLNLAAGQNTLGFAATTFWLTDSGAGGTGRSTLVTCTGARTDTAPDQLTGCSGVPATSTGAAITSGYETPQGTPLIGGWIKAEVLRADGTYQDVTAALLNLGIAGPSQSGACAAPAAGAILVLQRLRDSPNTATCTSPSSATNAYEWWPNTLFDTREALTRDVAPASGNPILGGVMHYVGLDAANLAAWFVNNGINEKTDNGYSVYFSDRRNNRNALSQETGEYGWEDFVNPASATGTANGTLDAGEDVNLDNVLQTYGQFPSYAGTYNSTIAGSTGPLTTGQARPWRELTSAQAMVNRAVLFRRALKLFNGQAIAPTITGLTIIAENPVYVEGDWNANGGWTEPHAATSVIADSVTLLSNNWLDARIFANPYNVGARPRNTQTWYRLAIVSGKGRSFPQPNGTATDFGTDGGAHNFLHYLENGDQAVNYQGSLVTFFFNRQAVGAYKCCATVYGAPQRNYAFDVDFLDPAKLPPLTPMFRVMNNIGFSQETRPGR